MLMTVATGLFVCLCIAYVGCWVALSLAAWPWGIVGLLAIACFGLFLFMAARDKIGNVEDARYNDQEEP